jgi:hypothetical protein
MRRATACVTAIIGCMALTSAGTAGLPTAPPRITAIARIPLKPGVNQVPHFLPDGGAAGIVQVWRENGNAHGYTAWLVLTGSAEREPFGLVPFAGDAGSYRDTIRDDPFDGERRLGRVVFAHARVDGAPATIAIDAHLDWTDGRPLADHERATIRVYRLMRGEAIGPPLAFESIATLHSEKSYCNVDLALRDVMGIALPHGEDVEGDGWNAGNGCYEG